MWEELFDYNYKHRYSNIHGLDFNCCDIKDISKHILQVDKNVLDLKYTKSEASSTSTLEFKTQVQVRKST